MINSSVDRRYIAAVRTQQVGQANVDGTKLAARVRLAGVRPAEARAALADPRHIGEDDRGNVAVTAEVAGQTFTFIVAADDPRFVITVIPRRS